MKRIIFVSLFIFIFNAFLINIAHAHRVIIFAWIDGEKVYTKSKFSNGKPVKAGKIIVYDPKGQELLTGKTDQAGEFFFKIPKKTALEIVLQASMGHQAKWTLPLHEVSSLSSQQSASNLPDDNSRNETKKTTYNSSGSDPEMEKIQRAMEKALDKKLKPFKEMIVASQVKIISLTEIMGGIGYILGLIGIASYFHYRRRQENTKND